MIQCLVTPITNLNPVSSHYHVTADVRSAGLDCRNGLGGQAATAVNRHIVQMRGNKGRMKASISANQEKMETVLSIGQGLRAIHESLMAMLNSNHQEIVAMIRAG
jgi:hypothetical protein